MIGCLFISINQTITFNYERNLRIAIKSTTIEGRWYRKGNTKCSGQRISQKVKQTNKPEIQIEKKK